MSGESINGPARGVGRPEATSAADIERAAFGLFARVGFHRATLEMIAAEVGVGRRTLFNYYRSKNDIPWGQFDRTLARFRVILNEQPPDIPVWLAVHRGVIEFNRFPADADPAHRDRMRLLLRTPELQAHAVLRYQHWRDVVAAFVGERMSSAATELLPRVAAHVSLALALESYDAWLDDEDSDLAEVLEAGMVGLRGYLR